MMRLYGIDFTSAPRQAKPITVAAGHRVGNTVRFDAFETLADWDSFDGFLQRPGPWLGAFDFPFGLPREAVLDLAWPDTWARLVSHCEALGKAAFRAALDAYRESRPVGLRYAHRAVDRLAGSHSALKLVNPPVGLMFLAGAPRLLQAGISLPGLHSGDPMRIALEAYPGLLARAIEPASYKNDTRAKQTPERLQARQRILAALRSGAHPLGLRLDIDAEPAMSLTNDPSGDRLDACLALLQAAHCAQAGEPRFGLPDGFDPIEGWIATISMP